MKIVNMYEAKTHLSQLVQRVLGGEEIILAKAGQPLVSMVPYVPPVKKKRYGLLKGQITSAPDFDAFTPELEDMFGDYLPDDGEKR